jgi:hypothetical protein
LPGFNEPINEFGQAAHTGMQNIHIEQGQEGNDDLVMIFEILDKAFEIAQGAKKPMKQHQRFPVAFLNKLEFFQLFNLVTHFPLMQLIFAKINVLPQNIFCKAHSGLNNAKLTA